MPRGSTLKVVGCIVALVLLIVLSIGAAALLQSSVQVPHPEPTAGANELDAVVARFAGSRQYIELVRRDGLITTHVHHEREPDVLRPGPDPRSPRRARPAHRHLGRWRVMAGNSIPKDWLPFEEDA